jgi:pimeloyl-ACP methyl ester carboxylesterase
VIPAPFLFFTLHDEKLTQFKLREPFYITASDSCKLAYYSFLPSKEALVNVIFYHGAGAWSGTYYQYMAEQLAKNDIGVFLVDIRGHGRSQGPRGDAPSTEQVYDDITTTIAIIHNKHPTIPLILGGHSSGAGLLLNYNSFYDNASVDGYFLCAPYLGPYADVYKKHTQKNQQFIKRICTVPLIIHTLSKGWLCSHWKTIFFNYPPAIKKQNQLLDYYTCAMIGAISPISVQDAFKKIEKPLLLCVGVNDEQFIAQKIIDIASYCNTLYKPINIDGANHFSILTDYTETIAAYLKDCLKHITKKVA